MILPTIHLNGTSKSSLMDSLCDASQALSVAIEKMEHCSPHPRDYYPQGDEAFKIARAEHIARLALVRQAHSELNQLAEKIADIGSGK